jgi:hypothetical protein
MSFFSVATKGIQVMGENGVSCSFAETLICGTSKFDHVFKYKFRICGTRTFPVAKYLVQSTQSRKECGIYIVVNK